MQSYLPNHKSNCSNWTWAIRGSLDHTTLPIEWFCLFVLFLFKKKKVTYSQLWTKFTSCKQAGKGGHTLYLKTQKHYHLLMVCFDGEDGPALARLSKAVSWIYNHTWLYNVDSSSDSTTLSESLAPFRACLTCQNKGKPAHYPQQKILWKMA